MDWIEAPAPDSAQSVKDAGFNIVTNAYPHNWTWHLSRIEGSPWNDIRVRKAANLAVDRDGLNELLGGFSVPAQGYLPPGHQWFGKPDFKLEYNVEAATKLMEEAGYGPDKRLKTKVIISSSGSGQMLPLAMNEYIQQTLAENRHRRRVRSGRLETPSSTSGVQGQRMPARRAAPRSTTATSSRIRSAR